MHDPWLRRYLPQRFKLGSPSEDGATDHPQLSFLYSTEEKEEMMVTYVDHVEREGEVHPLKVGLKTSKTITPDVRRANDLKIDISKVTQLSGVHMMRDGGIPQRPRVKVGTRPNCIPTPARSSQLPAPSSQPPTLT